jgi:hypothetical protein
VSRAPASRAERKLEATKAVGSARESSAEVPDGLDWQRFRAAYFPGSRRHNFTAIVAYGAYKRLRAVEPSSEDVDLKNERDERRWEILPLLLKLRRRHLVMEHPARLFNGRRDRIRLVEERFKVGYGRIHRSRPVAVFASQVKTEHNNPLVLALVQHPQCGASPRPVPSLGELAKRPAGKRGFPASFGSVHGRRRRRPPPKV